MRRRYWLARMCDNCPFADEGAGLQLRLSLAPGRWNEICVGLVMGEHFLCHKTTGDADEDDDEGREVKYPHAQICAGSRAWQAARGIISNAEQIMTRLEATLKGDNDAS